MSPRASRSTNRSIQSRTMVMVAAGVVLAIAVPGWVAWSALDRIQTLTLASLGADAATAATHVENVFRREWSKLQEVAAAEGVAGQAAAASPGAPAAGDPARALSPDILRAVYFRAELMDRTFVTDAQGHIVQQEPTSPPEVGLAVDGALGVMESGRPSVVPTVAGRPAEGLTLLVPVRDWQGRAVGVAGGRVSAHSERLAAVFRQHLNTPGATVEFAGPDGPAYTSAPPAESSASPPHRRLFRERIQQASGVSGTCRSCHDRSQPAHGLLAFAPLRSLPWGVAIAVPHAPALADAARLRTTLLWLGPVLMALGLLFAYGGAQSVLRPVRVLTEESERLAAGDLERPIPALGRDEIGRLGHSLEGMRRALQTSIQTIEEDNLRLEARVDERTRDLKALSQQLAEREEARARLLRQFITAQEDERKRLARELHDETCQTISALAMRMGSLTPHEGTGQAEMRELRALAVRALDELHRLIYDLRPSVLDDLGLWPAIRWYAERQLEPKGVAVRCEFPDIDRRLPSLYETALFRVSQEAISNIAKHAAADQVLIQGAIKGDTLTIEIEDDGRGFDPAMARTPTPDGHGWGLLGITERIDALGGRVHIDSAPGQGVRLLITVTLPPESDRV